jgi:hypothetical protein
MVEATASSHLEEVVGKAAAVVLVMALDEVLLDMLKDQLMMEEEKGSQFQLLVLQAHPLSFWSLINPIWFSIRVPL